MVVMTKVITRFPPSPTGLFHIGSARTALFNYLFARQNKGEFLMRFEDTDKERSKREFEDDILKSLTWLGITADNADIPRQSERTALYQEYLQKLIASGGAYEGEKSEKGEGNVIRFKNPNTTITFSDVIRGDVTVDTTDLGDFVIARSADEPIYHFTVVVDDILAGVTHVIRGEDHVSNTPRQILILEALGGTRPVYAHIPLILGPDKAKLSKRHGAASVNEYKALGYLPEAIINHLGLLGWHPSTDQEFFTIEELTALFTIDRVQKAPAVFDIQKLNDLNRQHLAKLSNEDFLAVADPFIPPSINRANLINLLPSIRERVTLLSELQTLLTDGGELSFAFGLGTYDSEKLIWKDSSREETLEHLVYVQKVIEDLPDSCESSVVKNALWPYAEEKGKGNVLWPLRFALTGKEKSPDPFTVAGILGKKETLARIAFAIQSLA